MCFYKLRIGKIGKCFFFNCWIKYFYVDLENSGFYCYRLELFKNLKWLIGVNYVIYKFPNFMVDINKKMWIIEKKSNALQNGVKKFARFSGRALHKYMVHMDGIVKLREVEMAAPFILENYWKVQNYKYCEY